VRTEGDDPCQNPVPFQFAALVRYGLLQLRDLLVQTTDLLDEAAMALGDVIQRMSLEHPRYGAAKVAELPWQSGTVNSLVTTDSDHDFLVYPNLAQYMVKEVRRRLLRFWA
jgi:hypothetical protein